MASVYYDGGEATYSEWRRAARASHPADSLVIPQRFVGKAQRDPEVNPTPPDRLEFLERLLKVMAEVGPDNFFLASSEYGPFFVGGKTVLATKAYANCNDLFDWACADAEEVTPENLEVLEQAVADVAPLYEKWWSYPKDAPRELQPPLVLKDYAVQLFACRVRVERPQGACYQSYPPELAALFDAAGPDRGAKRPYRESANESVGDTRRNLCPKCLERPGVTS